MLKIDDNPAAPDDQDPDAPERPTAEENDASNERKQYPRLGAQELQSFKIIGNHVATESMSFLTALASAFAPSSPFSRPRDARASDVPDTGVQSAGKPLDADIIGVYRRHFYNTDAEKAMAKARTEFSAMRARRGRGSRTRRPRRPGRGGAAPSAAGVGQ